MTVIHPSLPIRFLILKKSSVSQAIKVAPRFGVSGAKANFPNLFLSLQAALAG